MRFVPRWLVTLLVTIVIILLLGIVVAALGGFDWSILIGHFHWNIGVRR